MSLPFFCQSTNPAPQHHPQQQQQHANNTTSSAHFPNESRQNRPPFCAGPPQQLEQSFTKNYWLGGNPHSLNTTQIQTHSPHFNPEHLHNTSQQQQHLNGLYFEPQLNVSRNAGGGGFGGGAELNKSRNENNNESLIQSKLNNSMILNNYSRPQNENNNLFQSDQKLKNKFKFGKPSNTSILDTFPAHDQSLNDVNDHNVSNKFENSLNNSMFFNNSTNQFLINGSQNFWITVFGFGDGMMEMIIKDFSLIGQIEKIVKGDGNWVNLKYYNSTHANQALSRNGRIYANTFMLGVKKCTNEAVTGEGDGFNNNNSFNNSILINDSKEFATRSIRPRINNSRSVVGKSKSLINHNNNFNLPRRGLIERMYNFIFG